MHRDSGIIYRSLIDAVKDLDPEDRLEIFEAYFAYLFDGIKYVGDNKMVAAILTLIIPTVDKAQKRYEASVENGKKGGRPPKNPNKPGKNQFETKGEPNCNLNVADDDAVADDEAVYVYEDVAVDVDAVNESTVPLPMSVMDDIKEQVISEGDLTDLAAGLWVRPVCLDRGEKDIYVIGNEPRMVAHIMERYGELFKKAILKTVPDFAGEVRFAARAG